MFEAALVLVALVIVFVLFLAVERSTKTIDTSFFRRKWAEIENLSPNPHAVTEADKLLDHALKHLRYRGQTMGDRLKVAGPRFHDKDQVWAAHKLRNRLVHEADAKVRPMDVKRAISSYQRALKDLGAL